jgi:uroporphyrinogen decarboxylase
MAAKYPPLNRETVIRAVERKSPEAIPTAMCCWWGEELEEEHGKAALKELEETYPDDVCRIDIPTLEWDKVPYSWKDTNGNPAAFDSNALLPDWKHFDEFVELAPKVADLDFTKAAARSAAARSKDRYVMAAYWRLFFERPWEIRGMENLMMDYYDYPEMVHKLHNYLAETYLALYKRAKEEMQPDAIQSSDDLGNQLSLNISPATFKEFMRPYYDRVIGGVHAMDMHFWLHSCGNNTEVMQELIDAGLDMFHPVQKGTMNWPETSANFGGQVSWWLGFDVQHLLQEGSPDDVRTEVAEMIKLFNRPQGGLVLAAGNGITGGTPLENIRAFLDAAHKLADR